MNAFLPVLRVWNRIVRSLWCVSDVEFVDRAGVGIHTSFGGPRLSISRGWSSRG